MFIFCIFGFIRYKGHLVGYGQLRTERKILTVCGIRTHRDPENPHQRRKSTRIDSASNNAHAYSSAKEYDQKIFYELNDRVIVSMRDRFECETLKLLEKFEGYVTEKNSNITAIASFFIRKISILTAYLFIDKCFLIRLH